MSSDETDNSTIVRILYNALLNREPDPEGFALYISNLDSKKQTLHQIALDFVRSAEFVKKQNALDSDLITADIETIKDTFTLLYGLEASGLQMATMLKYGIHTSTDQRQLARRIIACMDRQILGTPYSIRFQERDLRKAACENFSLMYDEADLIWSGTIGAGHSYQPNLLSFFKQHLKSGMTVVDVGANIGYLSLSAARLVGDTGHVYAFEPNSENCRLMLLSLRQNGISNVTLLPVALGAAVGSAPYTPAEGSNGTLLLQKDHDSLLDPNCIIVPVFRLDDMVDRMDFMKADTEGSEGIVVQGAMNLITKNRPIIVAEYSPVMLKKNSHMDPREYLEIFVRLNYQISILSRDNPTSERSLVSDLNDFIASYGDPHRIEDLTFIPGEHL